MPGISLREAIRRWEAKSGISPQEATEVSLICQLPSPIEKLDNEINQFENCEKLSLSTNAILQIVPMQRLKNLKILSLARNNIKKIQNLEDVAATLEQLWLSYNLIERLDNLAPLQKLNTFYVSNNKIRSWDEVAKCSQLADLRSVLFLSNPVYSDPDKKANWPLVVKKIPHVESIDGAMVTAALRAEADALD
mmetsp:Transcript_45104/g.59796  ORF Transcript_45104/g.59796 Transcript_45104/m.59796 type:complete len:193 (-) Transcript_45104:151-729(-)|eukprot:CAMPEP_0185579482 /NCGR_PEP_ID=MMETSP0434-20130131/14920_1 /TAXON_ID=626734 ORGANISM="Favella taraikaensis, Strain Fe Narragansett Bay" /NCGR_SAMPLE_ID=MMETSP0434 /ASSEMBLY_ACC=CAM_ASM_000379 /LENGTH=192 /DNA_ID=CAMNT_0028197511 /DNA_START=18 /DNA_END=596 /DNA_ORIENTATION=+